MMQLVQSYGAPVALYVDRHAVFKHTPGSGLAGAPTQFSRPWMSWGPADIRPVAPGEGSGGTNGGKVSGPAGDELRLAGAATIADADHGAEGFPATLQRTLQRSAAMSRGRLPPTGTANVCLDRILCFKHRRKVARDNTVKFQLHTLQLLPEPERPSYAGAAVEVLEGLDGRLSSRQGRTIPSQEAPPNPAFMRTGNGSFPHFASHRSDPDHPADLGDDPPPTRHQLCRRNRA